MVGRVRSFSVSVLLVFFAASLFAFAIPAHGQAGRVIDLTLDSAVNLVMDDSYRVQQLKLGIERSRSWLEAERAGLRSNVYANVTAPDFEILSDNKWNSELDRYELVRENSRMWRANLSIEQPVILFGWPTNGYLSLNNRVYRYAQGGNKDNIRYYNRYYIEYEQPLFQTNELKNDIREAELDLEDEELNFKQDVVDLIDDIANDYYQLFELAYERRVYANRINNLEVAKSAAQNIAEEDTARSIEVNQLQVELGNAREQLSQVKSSFRLQASQIKQRLRLEEEDSLHVDPTTEITPIQVNEKQAIKYGRTLRPRLRQLAIWREKKEIDLENTKGNNSFRVDLEASYGREMQDPRLRQLFDRPTNSYTVGVEAYIPIWDWGRHEARVQARQIGLKKVKLRIEDTRRDIQSDIRNAIQNLEEYQRRTMNMRENLNIATQVANRNIQRYRQGEIAVLDLVQSIDGQQETALNFMNAYLGYREALLSLQEETYYDFENDVPLLKRFQMEDVPTDKVIVRRESERQENRME